MEKGVFISLFLTGVFLCLSQAQEPCIIPPNPRDGQWTNGNKPSTSVNHKTRLGVRCSNWRFTVRLSSLECNNGEWSDSDDIQRLCQGRPCRVRSSDGLTTTYDPPLREEDLQRNQVPHDTRVRYTCGRGYSLNGREETRCNHGLYDRSLTTPTCELVPCPVEEIAHGRLIYYSTSGRDNPNPVHWDTRQLRCSNGYQPLTSSSGRCDNGNWINDGTGPLQCYPKPCQPIPETNMRSIYYSTPQQSNGKYRNGTRVSVNCVSNYIPAIENGTAFCHTSRWWKAIPTCTQSFNRAIGARTSQKETNRNLVLDNSWLAVDGITLSEAQYCSRTSRVTNPWWKAEMTSIYNVTSIRIYNRLDNRKFDLVGAEVRVGMYEDHTANLPCGEPITRQQILASDEESHGIAIRCRRQGILGIIGNVVSVHIHVPVIQRRELSLCEVEVYTHGEPISVNGAEEGAQVGCIVPHVQNADIVSLRVAEQQVLLPGQDIRFECKPGYNLEGSPINVVDLICLSDSSWDRPAPVCNPQTCTVRRLINGGFFVGKIHYNHGDIISFSCNDGYEKEFNETYRCDFSRTSPDMPACKPASCNAPSLQDHMTSSQPRYLHDTLLTVSCEVGFQLSGNQERNQPRCVKGRWTASVNVICERVPCPRPGRGDLSSIEVLSGVEGYVHGARIRYSCVEGWEILGLAERECNNGQWTGSVPKCRIAAPPRCMLPERSNGEVFSITGYTGRIFDEGLPIGEQVTISLRSCNPGYTPQRYVRTGCSNVGEWTVPVPICERRERFCAKPSYISRIVQYVNGVDTKELSSYPHDELPEGTFVLSRCSLPGEYVMQGSANRTCAEGSWSGQEPSCVRAATEIYFHNNQPMQIRSNGTIVIYPQSHLFIYCRMPSWSRARANFISDNGPNAYYSVVLGISQMVISMNPPRPRYSGRYTCQASDQTISHSVFIQFAAIDCERPRAPTNGAVLDNDPRTQGRYPMGKQIIFTCNRGYNRDGASRSTCVFGEWSHRVPRCIRATCPELQPPHHGTKIGTNRVGQLVLFMCNQGYQLQGESFLTCLPTGNWSHPLPTCIEMLEPDGPCDVITCESWQRCVILPSDVGICGCISPRDCPAPDPNQSEICGTDGKNYTSMCHLKARACILSIDIEEASSTEFCINGVPEFVRTPPPPPRAGLNDWSSSSFESFLEDLVEAQTSPPNQPRSYSFCDADQCPTSTAEELCQNSSAIIVANANRWDVNTGILEMEIYEVMFGEMPTWTQGSYQEVTIDISAAPERGCICPSFHTDEPYIIGFSQDPSLNDSAQLIHTDIVLLYSTTLYDEIMGQLQATCPELQPPTNGTKIGGNRVNDSVIIGCNQGYQLQGESSLVCLPTGNWSHPLPKCIEYKLCGVAGNILADDDHQANEKAWPWLSIVHRNSSTGPMMICSGTLLCQQWVLTTSSCFANFPDGEVLGDVLWSFEEDKEITVTVTLGEYNVSVVEGCEQTISVDRIILHDQYDYDLPHDYDVALLHLSEPVELNSCARTICLPSETDTLNDPTIVGWGTASGLPQYTNDIPIQFPMPLVDQTKCQTVHLQDRSDLQSFDVTDRMLCAGKRFGKDPLCQGDHGSPLMYRRSGDDKWAIVGINTKGESCFRRNRYGIYTRIDDDLTQWINNVTSNCANDHIPSNTML